MSEYVDFHHVEPHQVAIHDRLQNWARWCAGRPTYWDQSAMFRDFRSTQHYSYGVEVKLIVDQLDAQTMEKAVSSLPADHRTAVRWNYVFRTAPAAAARNIGCSLVMLQRYVRDGRQMLLNRVAK